MSYEPHWFYLTHFGRVGDTHRVADQIKHDINEFVAIAQQVGSDTDSLKDRLMTYLIDRILENGCTLDTEYIQELLDMDITLNAQGISIWIDKH